MLERAGESGEVHRAEIENLARDWLAAVGANAALRVLTSGTHEAASVVAFLSHIVELTEADASDDESTAEGGAR